MNNLYDIYQNQQNINKFINRSISDLLKKHNLTGNEVVVFDDKILLKLKLVLYKIFYMQNGNKILLDDVLKNEKLQVEIFGNHAQYQRYYEQSIKNIIYVIILNIFFYEEYRESILDNIDDLYSLNHTITKEFKDDFKAEISKIITILKNYI